MNLPLNALRAFEASARHLSFTRAGLELSVTQSAVAAQVKNLESRLNVTLFRRLPRGLALTDEGQALLPLLTDSFQRMSSVLDQFQGGRYREPLVVGAVGTFAVCWLMPRIAAFERDHPFIDLRLHTHNNRVDLAGEGLDCAIRFGGGAWHGTEAEPLLAVDRGGPGCRRGAVAGAPVRRRTAGAAAGAAVRCGGVGRALLAHAAAVAAGVGGDGGVQGVAAEAVEQLGLAI